MGLHAMCNRRPEHDKVTVYRQWRVAFIDHAGSKDHYYADSQPHLAKITAELAELGYPIVAIVELPPKKVYG